MKVLIIVDAPEALISRGFNRKPWHEFDAVVIVRPEVNANTSKFADIAALLSPFEEFEVAAERQGTTTP